MEQQKLAKPELLKLVLQFLASEQYHSAVISLERDSSTRLRSYGPELDFFYDLVMSGRFEDAEKFLEPLCTNESLHRRILFQVKRQRFLEALEAPSEWQLEVLAAWVQDLETLAEPADFKELHSCLSLDSITEHPQYRDWTLWQGRKTCFEESFKLLAELYPVPKHTEPELTLVDYLALPECETGNLQSPRQLLSNYMGSPLPKECIRYSPNSDQDVSSNLDLLQVPTFSTNGKKIVSFLPDTQTVETLEEDKNVLVEALDVASASEDFGSCAEDTDELRSINRDLMADFDPCRLKEIAQISDSKPIRASAFNVSGDYFVLGTNSNSLKVCSLHNVVDGLLYNEHQGRQQYIDVVFEYKNFHYGSVYCVDWARSGTQIASGSLDRVLRILHCPDFLSLQETQSDTVVYTDGAYSAGEGELPSIVTQELRGHTGTIRTLCYNPVDERILLSAGASDGELFVWNTELGVRAQQLRGYSGAVQGLSASGTGSFFVSVGSDKKIRIWDLKTSKASLVLSAESFSQCTSVALSTEAPQLRMETKNKIASIFLAKQYGQEMSLSEKPCVASVGHSDGEVTMWDLTAGKLYKKHLYHTAECRSVQFSPDTNWLLSASFDSSVGVVDLVHGTPYRLEFHEDRVVSAKWHPYLPILVTTSADRTARVFTL